MPYRRLIIHKDYINSNRRSYDYAAMSSYALLALNHIVWRQVSPRKWSTGKYLSTKTTIISHYILWYYFQVTIFKTDVINICHFPKAIVKNINKRLENQVRIYVISGCSHKYVLRYIFN